MTPGYGSTMSCGAYTSRHPEPTPTVTHARHDCPFLPYLLHRRRAPTRRSCSRLRRTTRKSPLYPEEAFSVRDPKRKAVSIVGFARPVAQPEIMVRRRGRGKRVDSWNARGERCRRESERETDVVRSVRQECAPVCSASCGNYVRVTRQNL